MGRIPFEERLSLANPKDREVIEKLKDLPSTVVHTPEEEVTAPLHRIQQRDAGHEADVEDDESDEELDEVQEVDLGVPLSSAKQQDCVADRMSMLYKLMSDKSPEESDNEESAEQMFVRMRQQLVRPGISRFLAFRY